ncbi:mitochondrial carrier, partial [Mrakia frigida]|uniref:mitochondrial carrier n=1 Tax=Mrakia frigida TaxID=29902 RepID=UPI003FCBF399
GFRSLFLVPLVGSLVRFRANFTPRGVGLEQEEDARVGPVVTSLWGMIKRVKELEGFAGLYKGIFPYILSHSINFAITIIFLGASSSFVPSGATVPNPSGLRMAIVSLVVTFISLPLLILTNRAITTPYILPTDLRSFRVSLSALFTPHEREKPWVLYLTPGLLASTAAFVFWTVFVMRIVRSVILPADVIVLPEDGEDFPAENPTANLEFSAFRYFLFFFVRPLSTLVLTPLEVISTRLSLQRNHTSAYSALPSSSAPTSEDIALPYFAEGEDVVGFRSEDEPYEGMMDCARKMWEEEGGRVLARGWWITLGGNLARGFP